MKPYEFDGEKYKKASSHQREWGNNLISMISLRGNERILDLGCGDGQLTAQLAMLVPNGHVAGIDASAGMIRTAQKICRDNLTFLQMDINDLHFCHEFDLIFSNAALHWVKDHRRLLQNAYQALKSGGFLLWDFGSEGNCAHFLSVIQEKTAAGNYAAFFHDFEMPWFMPAKDHYEELIDDIGYSDYDIAEVNRDRYFPMSDDMIKWIDQPCIVPFLAQLSDEQKAAFRGEVITEMLKRTKQPDGSCFETFRRLQVYARK